MGQAFGPFGLKVPGAHRLTKGKTTMSSSKDASRLVAAWLVAGLVAHPAHADIGCPPTHDGKPLKDVELFIGPPSDKVELMPERGRFVVPYSPASDWQKYPPATLGCTYIGTTDMVTVVLPREIQACDFTRGVQVNCH
jgi:hypothetical protein